MQPQSAEIYKYINRRFAPIHYNTGEQLEMMLAFEETAFKRTIQKCISSSSGRLLHRTQVLELNEIQAQNCTMFSS